MNIEWTLVYPPPSFRTGGDHVNRTMPGLVSDSGCKNKQSKESVVYLGIGKRIPVIVLSGASKA